ncbi:malonyl-coenzyme:anthocyanin 5-O-glucoside-6'''-O-malonyltransferase-like [Carex rostrata]
MASTHPLPLKIIESSRVAPPPGTTPEHAILPFTYFDVFWIVVPPVERLFFYPYPHPTTHFLSSLLPSLKSSLSLALKTYYPLAGGFRRTSSTDDKLEHYYVEGDAVSFTVAECNNQFEFEHLASDHERDLLQLDCLVPELPKSEELQPLLAVQVTVFPDQGIVIGTSVHHMACDGTSSMQFMHTWAETCLSGASVSSRIPIFDRTLISDPCNNYSFLYNQVKNMFKPALKGASLANRPSELVLATFILKQEQIQQLKRLVLAKAEQTKTSFHCSTVVVVFAYVWTGFVRSKRIDSTKRVSIGIPADFRARIQPPLPMEYFGNCVGSCMATANAADLLEDDGVIVAAEAVGNAVDQLSERLKMLRNWLVEYATLSQVPILSIAGSPKFKVYDVDFGLGRPTKVEIVSVAKTGAMSVAESRDEEGGVEIGIAFPKDEMDCFNKYFFDGLKLLSE